jgi:hypothetical protein
MALLVNANQASPETVKNVRTLTNARDEMIATPMLNVLIFLEHTNASAIPAFLGMESRATMLTNVLMPELVPTTLSVQTHLVIFHVLVNLALLETEW